MMTLEQSDKTVYVIEINHITHEATVTSKSLGVSVKSRDFSLNVTRPPEQDIEAMETSGGFQVLKPGQFATFRFRAELDYSTARTIPCDPNTAP